jgi:hypothetical protein
MSALVTQKTTVSSGTFLVAIRAEESDGARRLIKDLVAPGRFRPKSARPPTAVGVTPDYLLVPLRESRLRDSSLIAARGTRL